MRRDSALAAGTFRTASGSLIVPVCLGGFVAGEAQMQKACGIIAISAIALSASQFASAQTVDQSSRTPDRSAAAREEVTNTLREAGFTNIRIMSESFLVHAIDPSGSPVVMVVHPDSQAIMPEASEDRDEAHAAEPGYPDSLTDLSEDEDEATAPSPRGGRIGKSSKLTDRPPMSEDEERAEDRQSPSRSSSQSSSQSPRMHDGSNQTAGNEKIPGRPNGMMTEMKEAEQRAQSDPGATRRNLAAARQSTSHQCAARLPTQSRRDRARHRATPNTAQQRQQPGAANPILRLCDGAESVVDRRPGDQEDREHHYGVSAAT
jgi:hypothetical protein